MMIFLDCKSGEPILTTMKIVENRLHVPETQYSGGKLQLPPAKEIPHVDLEVMNYHRPVFGTFHSKFTIVDRQIALLQSSNIQDNDNLEMLVHIEGPIVDGFYDAALLSWGKPLNPPLPLLSFPALNAHIPWLEEMKLGVTRKKQTHDLPGHTNESDQYYATLEEEAQRVNSSLLPRGEETPTQAVTRYLSKWALLSLINFC